MTLQMWLRPETITLSADKALLSAAVDVVGAPHLDLAVYFYESGIARIRLSETDGKPPRWEVRPSHCPTRAKPVRCLTSPPPLGTIAQYLL
jgi:hypothetical protein